MKVEEIRQLIDSELSERLEGERARLRDLRMSHSVTPLENTMQLREARTYQLTHHQTHTHSARSGVKGTQE